MVFGDLLCLKANIHSRLTCGSGSPTKTFMSLVISKFVCLAARMAAILKSGFSSIAAISIILSPPFAFAKIQNRRAFIRGFVI